MKIFNEHNKLVNIQAIEQSEQSLAKQYIRPDDVVLELGARYGSVSCTINENLNCKTNQVVVEPDNRVWAALEANKIENNCGFHIVNGFISNQKLKLINLNDCNGYGTTFEADENSSIPSFTLQEIKDKYNLAFNVLVADCEGFLETFFNENTDFCDNLRLVLFELDYSNKCNYNKIKTLLSSKGLKEISKGKQNVWIK